MPALLLCLIAVFILAAPLPAAAQAVPLPAAQDRVVGPIDETKLAPLPGHIHPLAQARFDQGVVEDSLPVEHLLLLLRRSPEQDQAAATLIDQLHNPNSPQYHQWLTPAEFGRNFGPTENDLAKLTGWLRAKGFTIDDAPPGRTHLVISGTAGQLRTAFHTELHRLNVNGQPHIAVLTEPQVPAALAPVIAGFRQLHDWHAKPMHRTAGVFQRDKQTGAWRKVSGPQSAPELTDLDDSYYVVGPQDWYTIYNANPLYQAGITGAGTTIAVLEETEATNQSDVDNFRSQFGLTQYPGTPNSTQGGINWLYGPGNGCTAPGILNSSDDDEESEAMLDVEWAGAVAPDAIVDFVACNSPGSSIGGYGTDLAASYVANYLSSTVVATSLSYGDCETDAGAGGAVFYSDQWQQMAAEGITAVVSAGDAGSLSCDQDYTYATNNLSTNAMSSTAYDVSAGGTDFSDFYQSDGYATQEGAGTWWSSSNGAGYSSALSYVPEITWNSTCADPLFVSVLQEFGNTTFGSKYTPLEVCNSTWAGPSYDDIVAPGGGGGGISQFNSIPTWQGGVYGFGNAATSAAYRNEPDLSFFASNGWWGHFLPYCDTDTDAGYPSDCDFSTSSNLSSLGAGGTSFVAPQIAGIMALVNQQTGSRQGVANYTLYNLAATEYGVPGSPNTSNLSNCSGSHLGAGVGSDCIFRDIAGDTPSLQGGTITSDIVQPCVYLDVTNCYRTSSYYSYGLSAVGNHTSTLAYQTAAGYDLATGLGSANVYNLVMGWNIGVSFPSTTSLSASPSTVTSATGTTTLTASVVATGRGGQVAPAGIVSFYLGSTGGTLLGTSTLSSTCSGSAGTEECSASATLQVLGSQLNPGSNSIVANFGGDGANDAPSTSSAFTVTYSGPTLQTQTITFPNPGTQTYGVSPFALTASASSGLTVTYTVLSGPATVNGSTLTITGAGSVTVQAAQAGNSQYQAATPASVTFSVNQATVSVSGITVSNKTYDGTTSATITGCSLSGVLGSDSVTCSATGNFVSPNAGNGVTVNATASLGGAAAGNYTLASTSVTGSANITPATPTLSLTCTEVAYDGNAHSCSGSATGVAGASVTGTWTYTYNGSSTAPTNAASYPVVGTFTSTNTNYASGGTASGSLVIGTATPTLTVTCNSVTFNSSAQTCSPGGSATGVAGASVTGTWTYTYNGSSTAPTNAASYPVVGTFTSADTNYASGGTASGSLVINKATPSLSCTCDAVPYSGSPQVCAPGGAAAGIGGATVSGAWTYSYNGSSTAPTNPGSYPVVCTFTSTNPNYTSGGGAGSATFVINPATPALSISCTEVTYDGNAHTCSGSATGIGAAAVSGSFSFNPASETNASSYSVTGTFTSTDSDYASGGSASGTLKIDAATPALSVTCAEVTYDGNVHGCTGTATGVGGAAVGGSFSFSPASEAAAGSYPVTGTFTSTDSDYASGGTAGGTLKIDAKAVTAAVTVANKTYDGTVSAILSTCTLTGVVGSDSVSCSGTGTFASANVGTGIAVSATVGLTGSADANYMLAPATVVASANITPATPALALSCPAVTYDGAAHGCTGTATGVGGAAVSGSWSFSPASETNAGTYQVTGTFASSNPNYSSGGTASGTLTISGYPVPAIGSLSPVVIKAGSGAFTLTVNGSGLVPGAVVFWNGASRTTTYVSQTQLTAAITAADIASSGTASVTVSNPSPGGGLSSAFTAAIDTASSSSGAVSVEAQTTTVQATPGQTVTVAVSLSGIDAGAQVSLQCVDLPTADASCTYDSGSSSVQITTSSSTAAGTYQVVLIFTVTQQAASAARQRVLLAAWSGLFGLPVGFFWIPVGRRKALCRGVILMLGLWLILCWSGCGGGGGQQTSSSSSQQAATAQSSVAVNVNFN